MKRGWGASTVAGPRRAISDHPLDLPRVVLSAAIALLLMVGVIPPALTAGASAPPNDNFANANVIPNPLPYTDANVNTTLATAETNEPNPGCGDAPSHTVWYKYVPSTTTTVIATVTPTSLAGNSIRPIVGAYEGTDLSSLVVSGCQHAGSVTNGTINMVFTVTAGQTYYFQVGSGYGYDGPTEAFNFSLNLQVPTNDFFAFAKTIPNPLPYTDANVNTTLATAETNEPNPGCGASAPSHTVWYKYVPSTTTTVIATVTPTSLAGNSIRPIVAAYEGTDLSSLVVSGCQYAGSVTNGTINMVFTVTAGQTYYFQVGSGYGYDGPTEAFNFSLNLQVPTNDFFAFAKTIPNPLPYTDANVNTTLATAETNEPNPGCGASAPSHTVWYKYVPSTTTTVIATVTPTSLAGNSIRPIVAAYEGTDLSSLVVSGCQYAGSVTNGTINMVFTVTAGQTYYFQVGSGYGYDGPTEAFNFSLAVNPGPATHLSLSGLPSPYVSGVSHSLTVTARDASNNVATGYRGTVHFTSTDPLAVLPANYIFTAADNGVHVFSLTLKTYGTRSVTAADTVTSSIKGSQSGIVVNYAAASFYPTSPRRILDTRATVASGNPTNIGLSGVFTAGSVRKFSVAGARYVGGGTALAVPANAVAVTGNLTVVNETAAGVIDLGPAATSSGTTSTLSFVKGDTRANNVTVGLAADGSLSAVYRSPSAGATTNLIFDVTGYFLPGTAGASYHTVTPGRVLDTRPTSTGTGATHIGPLSKLANRVVGTFPVAGVVALGGSAALVPSTAVAVTGNVTVTNATSVGYVALGPTMTTSPSTSTANVAKGTNVANGVTVALSGGKLQVVWCGTTGSSADVIFDVTGYFTAGAGGLSFYGIAPVRLLDSSKNLGITGPFASRTAQLFTVAPAGAIPSSAKAIAGNLTLLTPTANGWALISPEIVATPTTSTVNASSGHSEANGFDVALGSSGHVALEWAGTTGSTANLALDVTGYWK